MADTGAPWNLPYPLPTDLVRDGADAIKDLAEATAAGLDAAGNPGIGSNVVQTVKTDTFTTTSSSFTEVTGLTATITPSSNTSKILLLASFTMFATADGFGGMARFYRGSTGLTIAAASGSRIQAHTGLVTASDGRPAYQMVMHLLDSPASDSAQTYAVRVRRGGSASTVVIGESASSTANNFTSLSTLTVIEVAP